MTPAALRYAADAEPVPPRGSPPDVSAVDRILAAAPSCPPAKGSSS